MTTNPSDADDQPAAAKPKLRTTRWDLAKHLRTDEQIAVYLETVLNEDFDDNLLKATIGDVARAMGMTLLATRIGVAREDLFAALEKTGDPAAIVRALAAAMNKGPNLS